MKILLDTDIGSDIDDALALLLLLQLPNVEIVGITTVYGQVSIRAKVAKKILDAAQISVPCFAGAAEPLWSPMRIWHSGTEGQGVLDEEEYDAPLEVFGIQTGADDFIVETIATNPDEITLISLGALTNVAQAITKQPNICNRVKNFYFMGGGVTYHDSIPSTLEDGKPYAARPSHNVRCDVRAAHIVFESALPIHLLTNDITTSLWWDGEQVQQLIQCTTPPANMVVGKLLDVWLKYRTKIFRREMTGTCPHDALTVAEATGHSFVSNTPGKMTVHWDASTTFVPSADGSHLAGIGIDDDRFLEWFSRHISQ